MPPFGLPDNFCLCFDLKKGGNIIGGLCLVTSVISCIMLTIYLCSDLDKITQEIADNSDEMKQTLEENSGCEKYQLFLTFNIRANKSAFSSVQLLDSVPVFFWYYHWVCSERRVCWSMESNSWVNKLHALQIIKKFLPQKSQKKMIPFLAVVAVTIITGSIIAIFQFQKGALFAVLTGVVVFIYFFICTYALYKSLDNSEFRQHDFESN